MKGVIGTLAVLAAFAVFITVAVSLTVRLVGWVESWALDNESEYDRWKRGGGAKEKRRVIASDKARRRSTLTISK